MFIFCQGQPILIIGHHILHGKVQQLEKPWIIVSRTSLDAKNLLCDESDVSMTAENAESEIETGSDNSGAHYLVTAVIRSKIVFRTRPKPIITNVPKRV